MVVSALPQMSQDLNLSSETATQALMSLFILGWSLGQVVMGPLSERYGRARLLNGAHAIFLVTTLLCSFETNGARFLIWRLLGGISGSAPLAVSSKLQSSADPEPDFLTHGADRKWRFMRSLGGYEAWKGSCSLLRYTADWDSTRTYRRRFDIG